MQMGKRQPTHIMVKVLELSELLNDTFPLLDKGRLIVALKPLPAHAISLSANAAYGTVETPRGLFAFNSEGIGSSDPVSISKPLIIECFANSSNGSIGFTPVAQVCLDDAQLRELPTLREEPLHRFIRADNDRVENNYIQWRLLLEQLVKQGDAIHQ